MGLLVEGQWRDRWYDNGESGRFERKASSFRNWVTSDGAPGPSGQGGFAAEPGRYHLYVSLACPWAHRALIMRARKGLEASIPVSVVHWHMGERGWTFAPGPGVMPDPIHQAEVLYQVYQAADPAYTGRVTVPVLWDKHRGTIVSNESSEIIRMFDTAFAAVGARPGTHYPEPLRPEIDAVNARIYDTFNNGVYRAGFATTQAAYAEAFATVFATLDWLEARLARQRYLVGNSLTEADIRLYTTLVRFDAVYHGHFKCNRNRIVDQPAVWAYLRDLFGTPGFGDTTDLQHIKHHYYESHPTINPTGIVPLGPALDFTAPQDRDRLGGSESAAAPVGREAEDERAGHGG